MIMATQEFTRYEVRDRAAWITLHRPEARNALSTGLVNELYAHLETANQDAAARVIVITGAGKSFCAGADLKNRGLAKTDEPAHTFDEVLSAIWNADKPVIAAINGHAFGGGLGLVGAADIAISTTEAAFSFSEVRIGVIPAIISVVCLRKLGTHHGMRLFLTGERFDGVQAVDYGLVHRAVESDVLISTVEDEIRAICLGGPNALVECKKLVRLIPTLDLEEGFQRTLQWSQRMFASEEGTEGMAAFSEKRKPNWVEPQ